MVIKDIKKYNNNKRENKHLNKLRNKNKKDIK